MESLILPSTQSTPSVILDKSKNKFSIKGVSLPENCMKFYEPVINWIVEYFKDPNESTVFEFNFNYMNTSSSKIITDIIQLLNEQHIKGLKVKVDWGYNLDDNETLEFGENLISLLELPIELSPSN